MNLYVSVYHHRHGEDVLPMLCEKEPGLEEMKAAWESAHADLELERDDEYLECRGPFTPVKVEPDLNTKKCDDAGCPGWFINDETDGIERCDTCQRFKSDDEASAYVRALEALDIGRHFDAAAHRALVEVRDELAEFAELVSVLSDCKKLKSPVGIMKKLSGKLEVILGRSFWLEKHHWSDHAIQFAGLLSELYAMGEESEDTETMQTPGYFSVKISQLSESMDLPWNDIMSIFERADAVFHHSLQEANKKP